MAEKETRHYRDLEWISAPCLSPLCSLYLSCWESCLWLMFKSFISWHKWNQSWTFLLLLLPFSLWRRVVFKSLMVFRYWPIIEGWPEQVILLMVVLPKIWSSWDFPGGPVAKTCFQYKGPGSIPGQGTRSYMPQLRVWMLQLKLLYVTTKACLQPNK